jgi:hypothetical protein
MADVIPFPTRTFSQSDRAELPRWGSLAPGVADWWVQPDPETRLPITRTEDGEYAGLSIGGPDEPAVYLVEPHRGQWELTHTQTQCVWTFKTLREALESVCRTIHDAA